MFARVLYVDKDMALELNWLGLGKLRAVHRLGGKRSAHPMQKRCFLAMVRAFEEAGQPVHPSNPKCMVMMRDFADLLLHHPPSSIGWKLVFDDPEGVGIRYAR